MPNIFKRLLDEKDRAHFLRRHFKRKAWEMKIWIKRLTSLDMYSQRYLIKNRLGLRLLLDQTSLVDRLILLDGTWEPEQIELMSRAYQWLNTQQMPIFLDIGSYWGLYSLLASKLHVEHIHAFEADPKNHTQLRAQLFLNESVHKINVHHVAVSDHTGAISFRPSEKMVGGNRGGTGVVAPETADAITLECVALDDLFDLEGATIVGKLDVEGHEPAVLRGMARLASKNRVFLQVEEFPEHRLSTSSAAESLGLRCVRAIDVDRYYTNIPDTELEWLK